MKSELDHILMSEPEEDLSFSNTDPIKNEKIRFMIDDLVDAYQKENLNVKPVKKSGFSCRKRFYIFDKSKNQFCIFSNTNLKTL